MTDDAVVFLSWFSVRFLLVRSSTGQRDQQRQRSVICDVSLRRQGAAGGHARRQDSNGQSKMTEGASKTRWIARATSVFVSKDLNPSRYGCLVVSDCIYV